MPPSVWKRGERCGHGPAGRLACCLPSFYCPRSWKQEQFCKCGNERCGKGLCKPHGINKWRCKREGCRGGQVCEHGRSKYDCKEGNCPGSSRCPHGSLRSSRCAKCLSEPKAPPKWRQAAKKLKDCEACEGESPLKPPAARLPKGRTVLSSFVFAELLLSRASPVDM